MAWGTRVMIIGQCLAAQVVTMLSMAGHRMTGDQVNWRKPICRRYMPLIGNG